ncbi:probable pectin methylesterase CGR3 isoform X1 [Primulina huaijiensis]|uniref:probable pectin methylesterase CGR3 isoform X1 n=1 Tax=Primulina huaijiensis TaxID=1492673 RepID=UPI003CC7349E
MAMAMARRPINPSRRTSESGAAPFASSLRSRSRSHPYLPTAFIIVGGFLLIGYFYRGRGTGANKFFSRVEGDFSCTVEVQRAIPLLKMAYGGSMHRVLHVGPDTCSVVSRLLKEKDTEAWGVEPYDIEDADRKCKSLVHRGIVRVADIKFPLPYRAKSFSHVIVSDALDYLSPKYLNRTLPELARVSADGVVIFTGYPHHQKAKVVDKAKYGRLAKLRSSIWWIRYFVQMSLEENEAVIKKFEQAAVKRSYTSNCQIFHLNSYS